MKNIYTTLYVVRHGQSEWNEKGLVQGQTESPLTTLGEEQAKQLGKELRHIHFDKVFASDLTRARQTAELISLERQLEIETTKLLRERQFGHYEGKPWEALRLLDEMQLTVEEDKRFSFKPHPDIESDEELVSRFITFLREVSVSYPGKTLLVVTHGGIIRALLLHLGLFTYKDTPRSAVSNTAYIQLESDGVDFFVKQTHGITTTAA